MCYKGSLFTRVSGGRTFYVQRPFFSVYLCTLYSVNKKFKTLEQNK